MEEHVFASHVLGERARTLWRGVLNRTINALEARSLGKQGLPRTPLHRRFLVQTVQWTIEVIKFMKMSIHLLKLPEMWRFLDTFLLFLTTGLSLKKVLDIQANAVANPLSLKRVRCIAYNIKAYKAFGRSHLASDSWTPQRDETQQFDQFEMTVFRTSRDVFFDPVFGLLTLDDDLYGTGVADNQLKTLSSRKVDREGHVAHALADELCRFTLALRFRRREQSQKKGVEELLDFKVRGHASQGLSGFIRTADRGYGPWELLMDLSSRGASGLFVMPEHFINCHPLAGHSFVQDDRRVNEEDLCDSEGV